MTAASTFNPEKFDAIQSYTGEGVTETLRIALERLARAEWSRKMLALEGAVTLDIDIEALREDRAFDASGDVIR